MSTDPRRYAAIDDRYFVESAARTLQLLQAVADIDAPAPLATIVARLGWSKPAAYRLVRTLEAIGALRQQDGKGFVLGPALIALGQSAIRATRLPDVARPQLEWLRQELEETIVLTVLDRDEVMYLDRIEADKILIPSARIGSRLPAYCTSTGQVLLAGLPDAEVRERLAGCDFAPMARNTLGSIEALLERLVEVRRRGYAINDEELTAGHRAAAAPIRDHTGAVVAAVSVSVPAARVTVEQLVGFAEHQLAQATETISRGLGAPPAAA